MTRRLLIELVLGACFLVFQAHPALAEGVPIDDPTQALTAQDRDVLTQNLAQIPSYRLDGFLGIKVSRESSSFVDNDLAWQFDGQYLNFFYPASGQPANYANRPIDWGHMLVDGLASKDLYRMFYDHPDWRDQYLTWVQMANPSASVNAFLSLYFRGDHDRWYTQFGQIYPYLPDGVAQLQRDLFMAALESKDKTSNYFTENGVSIQRHDVPFYKTRDALVIGNYTLLLKDGYIITDILQNGFVLESGLGIPIADVTLEIMRSRGDFLGADAIPTPPVSRIPDSPDTPDIHNVTQGVFGKDPDSYKLLNAQSAQEAEKAASRFKQPNNDPGLTSVHSATILPPPKP